MPTESSERGKRKLEQAVQDTFPPEISATFLATLAKVDEKDLSALHRVVGDMIYKPPEYISEYVVTVIYPRLRLFKKELGIGDELFGAFLNTLGGTDDIAVNPNRKAD